MPDQSSRHDDPALALVRSLPREARNLLAGGLAGMLAKTVVAPIDRIKILYQVTSAQFRLKDVPRVAYSIIEKEGPTALWKGNTATMMRVFPYSGIQFMVFDYCKVHFLGEKRRKASSGSGSNSREVAAGDASIQTNMTRRISHRGTVTNEGKAPGDRKAGLTPIESLISGMIAGAVSVMCTYPLDLARAQLAVLRKKKKPLVEGAPTSQSKKGIGYVLTQSYRRAGATGLYRGIAPTILGILPYSGVAFTINEQAKRQLTHIRGREPTTVERLQCGALSGLFAQTLAYPLEVTRRRMQTIGIVPTSGSESAAVNFAGVSRLRPSMDELPTEVERATKKQTTQTAKRISRVESVGESIISSSGSQHHKPPGMITTMQHLLEEQGIRGFYKGVSMNWVKGPVAFSISFTAFDTIQGWLTTEEEWERKGSGNDGDAKRFVKSSKISIQRRITNNEDGD